MDELALFRGDPAALCQVFDVEAECGGCRNSSGGSMRRREQAELFQVRHGVPNGGGGDVHVAPLGQRAGTNRLCSCDVLLDDGLEDLALSLRELYGVGVTQSSDLADGE